jgi:probable phosphoglycerate mutase
LAGFGSAAVVDSDLSEWDYGEYEGLRTSEILQQRPGWNLFRDGCPNGEVAVKIGARVDRAIERMREAAGNVLVFSHGHCLRVLTARWLGLPATDGRLILCSAGSLGILSFEHNRRGEPVLSLWNDIRHLEA